MSRDKKILVKGIPASSGIASGKTKILHSPDEANKMENGDILVAVETNPEYTVAILKASAIVTDRGGLLSHPAIVARELGIPAVVGTQEATKKLHDNMEVIVNGNDGTVYEK